MKYLFDEKLHLHSLDGKPLTGTSSVEAVLAKTLTWWASGLAVAKFGWTNSKKVNADERMITASVRFSEIKELSNDEYLELLDEAYKAHSVKLKDSAKSGTDLHAELEQFVRGKMGISPIREYDPKIKPFIDWSEENVKRFLWSEAHCFDEELWVGGITDAGAELKDGRYAVVDFKSSKEVYANQFIQAAGYAKQIDRNGLWDKDGKMNKKLDKKIDALIVVPFGAEKIVPEIRYVVEEYKKGFEWCVGLYRLLGYEDNIKKIN